MKTYLYLLTACFRYVFFVAAGIHATCIVFSQVYNADMHVNYQYISAWVMLLTGMISFYITGYAEQKRNKKPVNRFGKFMETYGWRLLWTIAVFVLEAIYVIYQKHASVVYLTLVTQTCIFVVFAVYFEHIVWTVRQDDPKIIEPLENVNNRS